MIKKLLFGLAICLIIAGCKTPVRADDLSISDVLKKIPATNIGIFYNITDSKVEFTSTFKALSYKGFNLNLGYATEKIAVVSLAYEIIRLEKLGIEVPILKDIIIDAGWTLGYRKLFDDNEFVQGPSITLKVHF